ncbi:MULTISPECIES: glycoside hydrolase family 15 protein [unclassified Yimella]|uniref:glycoside hydrolase family 15 protein n=1 Tax=unclassified Yimella TaxID=2649892 RepID=UPI00101B701D|nr:MULTISPECIES: glycoside hydrolase family 15 protein [unclassified Yimella]MCG8655227.1 glycoside hydrolase family 15 protein [Yimella sp. NH-Cas1]RYG77779.1 glycoside hydrolase family 15 protein [Yimella sp. RIT 621]
MLEDLPVGVERAREPAHTPIEDYAIIGDTETAALVSRFGSIDWLCLPRFDSGSCFTNLLGTPEHGRWLLRPFGPSEATRRYVGNTSILETTHRTATGIVKITDLMPLGMERADLVRIVDCIEGEVEMQHEWIVRFNYGRTRPWVSHHPNLEPDQDALIAIAGPDMLVLRSSRGPQAEDGTHRDRWTMRAGGREEFVMNWHASWKPIPPPTDVEERVAKTFATSEAWASACTYEGPYEDAVVRSLLVLRLLTDTRRGGIVAAPTTSLPEDFGGVRNWDYRYCWLRDAALTLEALLAAGFVEATDLWRDWLIRAIAGDPEDMQIMYAVDGGRELPERKLDHLPGYADSKPVRIGNGAVDQRQTDVLGEVMIALEDARTMGLTESERSWAVQRALVENLAEHWDQADNGLWEIRGPLRHFTHSRVMVWAAFDRAISAVEDHGTDGPVEHWRELRDRVRAEIMERGFNSDINSFVQHYGTTEVDASLLLIPLVGFLPGDDPKVLGTIERIEQDLMRDGLLLRYRTEAGVDGLPGDEHPFLACSFWLVSAYAKSGRLDDAHRLMQRLVGLCNDVGLLAEEYDVDNDRMVGNFPQAFSHLTLVGAAVELARAEKEAAATTAGTRPA